MNTIGRHLLDDIEESKGTINDNKHSFLKAVVAISSPRIDARDEAEFNFEERLTSKPLLDLKRSK